MKTYTFYSGKTKECQLIRSVLTSGDYGATRDIEEWQIVRMGLDEDWELRGCGLLHERDVDYLTAFVNGVLTGVCRMEGLLRDMVDALTEIRDKRHSQSFTVGDAAEIARVAVAKAEEVLSR